MNYNWDDSSHCWRKEEEKNETQFMQVDEKKSSY